MAVVDMTLEVKMVDPATHVVISKEDHEELLDCERFLECLRGAGVDNWDGYEHAQEAYDPS